MTFLINWAIFTTLAYVLTTVGLDIGNWQWWVIFGLAVSAQLLGARA